MFHRPYFRELFLTMSRDRPRLLITIEPHKNGVLQFYSVPQVPYEKSSSSLVIAADSHMKFPPDQINLYCSSVQQFSYGYALICFSNEYDMKPVIINPNTGQYAIIPKLIRSDISSEFLEFLGFDPIGKQFKLLSMAKGYSGDHRILTLGAGDMMWRKIECPLAHEPLRGGICINGVLYYIAEDQYDEVMIVCFDVRTEKFKSIPAIFFNYWSTVLINYKGKLGGITLDVDVGANMLRMFLLEDTEKQEWSKHVYTLTDDKIVDLNYVSVAGVTSTGDIVSYVSSPSKPFFVFYFNPERNTLQTVEIQGNHQVFDNWKRVYVNHVEDLNFNIMNATSKEDHHKQQEHHQKQGGRRLQEEDASDLLELMTPLGKRILRDRPVKPSTKAKKMIWQAVGHGRGNRDGRG